GWHIEKIHRAAPDFRTLRPWLRCRLQRSGRMAETAREDRGSQGAPYLQRCRHDEIRTWWSSPAASIVDPADRSERRHGERDTFQRHQGSSEYRACVLDGTRGTDAAWRGSAADH